MLFGQKTPPSGPQTGKRVAHAGIMFMFMLVVQLIATVLIALAKISGDPSLEMEVNSALTSGNRERFNEVMSTCTYAGALVGGLVALLPYVIRDIKKKEYCMAKIRPWEAVVMLSAGVTLDAALTLVTSFFPDQGSEATTELISKTDPWIAFIAVGIITPLVEEMYFRRAIINSVKDRNKPIAMILSAVIFAMMHNGATQIAYALVFGLLFAYIYVRTDNLLYSVLIHTAINSTSALNAILGDSADYVIIPLVSVCAVVTAVAVVMFVKKRRTA